MKNEFRMNENVKPPVGVMPTYIWYTHRIEELSRATHEYIMFGDYSKVPVWTAEMLDLINKLKNTSTQETLLPTGERSCSSCGNPKCSHDKLLCQTVAHEHWRPRNTQDTSY